MDSNLSQAEEATTICNSVLMPYTLTIVSASY